MHDQVTNALSPKEVIIEFIDALLQLESNLANKIRQTTWAYTQYQKHVYDLKKDVVCQYWLVISA